MWRDLSIGQCGVLPSNHDLIVEILSRNDDANQPNASGKRNGKQPAREREAFKGSLLKGTLWDDEEDEEDDDEIVLENKTTEGEAAASSADSTGIQNATGAAASSSKVTFLNDNAAPRANDNTNNASQNDDSQVIDLVSD